MADRPRVPPTLRPFVRSGLSRQASTSTSVKAAFAANLLDAEESTIEPAKELVIDGKKAGELGGFQIGVRREIWIYLLIAAIILTAIEWITYHRRLTV